MVAYLIKLHVGLTTRKRRRWPAHDAARRAHRADLRRRL